MMVGACKLLISLIGIGLTLAAVPDATAQVRTLDPVKPPLSHQRALFFQNNPEARKQFMSQLPRRPAGMPVASPAAANPPGFGGTWQTVTAAPGSGLSNPLLLTDGTVIVHAAESRTWYRLTPSNIGSYANGMWTKIALLPSGYGPQYFASAVLPDGRVIINGGEYNLSGSTEVWTNLGAIYDPVADTWTSVAPPNGGTGQWSTIGDAQSIVLPDGNYMLASCCANPSADALFNASSLTWSNTGAPNSYQNEQGYTLLPDGTVLTINVWSPPHTQKYNPGTGTWSAAADTPVSLIDPTACGNYEIGPAVLRPDGTVVAFGGNTGCTASPADPTAIYNSSHNTWIQGPYVPAVCGSNGTTSCDLADAPAAPLPSGNILFAASSGYGSSPTHFFEFGIDNTITQVADPVYYASSSGAYYYNFLILPNGQILMTDFSNIPEIYTPTGSSNPNWTPGITSVPSTLAPGQTYQLNGTQLNGVSQGAAYGDDAQGSTNYPLVQITNNASGHVFYARTSGFSTMSVAAGQTGSTNFLVPASIETGASSLVVVANGIASHAVAVTVGNLTATTTTVVSSANPSVYGQLVTFTTTVSGSGGTPTGTVTFKDGGTTLGTGTLSAGRATYQTSALALGSHSITAVYGGDTNFATSTSSTVTQTVNQGSTTTAVASSTNPSVFGQQVTFTATILVTAPASGTPSGTVTFKDGGTTLGTGTLSAGSATYQTATLSGGGHTITAVYGGNTNFATSTSPGLTQTVDYTITVSAAPAAGGTVGGGGAFQAATSQTVTATPNSGYTFTNWTEGGTIVSTSASYNFTLNASRNLIANFSSAGTSFYVSPRSGSDINSCTVTAPCATLDYALSLSGAGGTIVILDSGVFGPIVITQPVIIDGTKASSAQIVADPSALVGCVGGALGSCSANNGYGVEIAAGTADSVTITHVLMDAGPSGGAGALKFTSGGAIQLSENTYRGNDTATGPIVALYPNNPGTTLVEVYFSHSEIAFNNPNDVNAGAVDVKPAGNTSLKLHFNHCELHNASYGIRSDASSLSGPSVNIATAISQSEFFSLTNVAVGVFSSAGTGIVNATVEGARVLNANVAIQASGLQATVILTGNTISGNGTGVLVQNGAQVYTPQSNTIRDNGTDLSGPLSSVPPR